MGGHKLPKKYRQFIERFPKLGEAWELLHEAEAQGPLDARTRRLLKLALAIGALKEGAVHAAVRKGLEEGVPVAEMEQVVALAASTLGLPSAVAAHTWIRDLTEKDKD